MPEKLSPEESKPAPDTPIRLPEMYNSPDRTIRAVAQRALKADDQPSVEAQGNPSRPRFGPVTEVTINKLVLREARRLAQGDLARLVLRRDGTVYVANSARHARLIRKNLDSD